MIRLGVTGYDLGAGLDELIRVAKVLDVQVVELWPKNLEGLSPKVAKANLEKQGLSVECFTLPFADCLNHPDESQHLQRVLEAIPLASQLGARFINIKIGAWPERSAEQALTYLLPVMTELGDNAARNDLKIMVENMVDHDGEDTARANWSRSPESLRTLLDRVDHPSVKVTYDPTNFLLAGYEPFPLGYDLLKPHIAYVHAKDAALKQSLAPDPPGSMGFTDGVHQQPFVACSVGMGAVNWAGIIDRLKRDGYTGALTLDGFTPENGRDAFYSKTASAVRQYLQATTAPATAEPLS